MAPDVPPQLVVLNGPHAGTAIVLDDLLPVVLGRRCGVRLPEPELDAVHCQVFFVKGRAYVQDFESPKGTWVGEERVQGVVPLEVGKPFRVGQTHLALLQPRSDEPATPEFVEEAERVLRAAAERSAWSSDSHVALDSQLDAQLAQDFEDPGTIVPELVAEADTDFAAPPASFTEASTSIDPLGLDDPRRGAPTRVDGLGDDDPLRNLPTLVEPGELDDDDPLRNLPTLVEPGELDPDETVARPSGFARPPAKRTERQSVDVPDDPPRGLEGRTTAEPIELPGSGLRQGAGVVRVEATFQDVPLERQSAVSPGDKVGDYQVLLYCGGGELGEVYKSYDQRRQRTVAVKFLWPQLARNERCVTRFLRGAKVGGRLRHPHLVAVHGTGHVGERVYMTMEYVDGPNLEEACQRQGNDRLPPSEALRVVLEVTSGLVYAHKRQVLHRNVKPTNIILDPDRCPKLCDLALAKRLIKKERLDITRSEDTLISSPYAAPELLVNPKGADERADVFGLGGTLYRILTGQPPRPNLAPGRLFDETFVDPREHTPQLSEELVRALRQALHPEAEQRFANVRYLYRALATTPEGDLAR